MSPPPQLHRCPGGCGLDVGARLFACRSCWRRIPHRFRRAITDAYDGGAGAGSPEHAAAMAAAVDWLNHNRAASDGPTHRDRRGDE